MATKLWQPLGAEADATWSLDSEGSGFEKMESGLNATPVDYARFGELFLHEGEWNGARIVSEDWVREATAPNVHARTRRGYYQYFWWIDTERPDASTPWGTSGSTSTWLPTRVPSSFGAVATGAWTTTRG